MCAYSYIGRKRLYIDEEIKLEGLDTLIYPKYSYWTLCYMLSQSGAQKLLAQRPLQKMLPVDEYFPIMFNEHPRYATYMSGLMIMASHQTFSGQLWHLTDQSKFDQTNLLYIISGEVYKFTIC